MAQHQGSLVEQLQALIPLANKAGLYDAADMLRDTVERQAKKEHQERMHEVRFEGIEWDAAYSIRPTLPDSKTYRVSAYTPRQAEEKAKDMAYEEEGFLILCARQTDVEFL